MFTPKPPSIDVSLLLRLSLRQQTRHVAETVPVQARRRVDVVVGGGQRFVACCKLANTAGLKQPNNV